MLFARVKLPRGYVNVFTTHTQASYIYEDKDDEIPSYYVRLKQLVQAKRFVESTLSRVAGPQDLSLFLGDLNVNANQKGYPFDKVLAHFENPDAIRAAVQSEDPNEYDLLMHILNNTAGSYRFSDCMYEQHNTFKVTYGDCLVDEDHPLVG